MPRKNDQRPCTREGCDGTQTFEPRQLEVSPTLADPIGEQGCDPCWRCDACEEIEWVDDDGGTGSMFGGAE